MRIHADSYSDAIPIDELLEMARRDVARCGDESEDAIRRCAEIIVREKLCPCASSISEIVDVLVEEYRKHLSNSGLYARGVTHVRRGKSI